MNEAQIKASYYLAAKETMPPMAPGSHGEWWFRKGISAAKENHAAELQASLSNSELLAEIERLRTIIKNAKDASELID